MEASNFFLKIEGVSKTFPGVRALNDVKFDIKPGEVHALVGENGAGKSTLIKILAGVYQPDKGAKIFIEDELTDINRPLDAVKKGISIIYQDLSLFPNLSVAENISLIQQIEKSSKIIDWKTIRKIAKKALDSLGSDISPDETLENISIAKQQIVAIASAIAQNAK